MRVDGVDQRGFPLGLEGMEGPKERRVREANPGPSLQEKKREAPFTEPHKAGKSKVVELSKLKEDIQRLQELLRERIREFLERHSVTLRYTLDRDTDTVITQLVEEETGEVVRQIPSEVALKIKATMARIMKGEEEEGR